MKTKSQGFTIIELIITLALAAVVLGLAVPSAKHMFLTSSILSINNDVVAALQFARSEAIKRNVPVTVCSSTNGSTCNGADNNWDDGWIVFVEDVAFDADPKDETIIRKHQGKISDTMTIRSSRELGDNFNKFITYLGSGYPVIAPAPGVPATGEFWVCEDNDTAYSRRIVLNPSGRIDTVGEVARCRNI